MLGSGLAPPLARVVRGNFTEIRDPGSVFTGTYLGGGGVLQVDTSLCQQTLTCGLWEGGCQGVHSEVSTTAWHIPVVALCHTE